MFRFAGVDLGAAGIVVLPGVIPLRGRLCGADARGRRYAMGVRVASSQK